MRLLVSFLVTNFYLCKAKEHPLVRSSLGPVEGFSYTTESGMAADVFLGIPFAQPPIDDLRFEKPVPIEPWTETLAAKEFGAACLSLMPQKAANVSEDCLTLNIVRPAGALTPNSTAYPVMVFLYGGAFIYGSSAEYGYKEPADALIPHDVIFVSLNYRLGPFGFFSTGDAQMPGNLGLWDQVEALRFLKKVIGDFGGDHDNVVLWGVSAGGVSTSWLSLSPHTKPPSLPNPLNSADRRQPFLAPKTPSVMPENWPKISGASGRRASRSVCAPNPPNKYTTPAANLYFKGGAQSDRLNFVIFNPRFDGDFVNADNFANAVAQAPSRPFLLGINSMEIIPLLQKYPGMNENAKYFPIDTETAKTFNRSSFQESVNYLFALPEFYGEKASEVAAKFVSFYESQLTLYSHNKYVNVFAQSLSDLLFVVPALREARMRSQRSPVFFYRWSFVAKEHQNPLLDGAGYGSELGSFFKLAFSAPPELVPDVVAVRRAFVELFVSFVKTGKPTASGIALKPVTSEKVPFMDVNPSPSLHEDLWPERIAFWNRLAHDYGFDLPSGKFWHDGDQMRKEL